MTKKFRPPSKEDALKVAKYLGCRGAHQDDNGNWMPCADHETLTRISTNAETSTPEVVDEKTKGPCWPGYVMVGMKPGKNGTMVPNCVPASASKADDYSVPRKKKRRKQKLTRSVRTGYEPLGERGITSIDTLAGGGLVSGKNVIIGRAKPRRGDPDVYDDPNAARLRSRSLGCIGIARRTTPDGDVVWTPCTNVSDYRRQTGASPLARRDEYRRFQEMLREVGGPAIARRRTGKKFNRSKTAFVVDEKNLRRLADYGTSYVRPIRRSLTALTRKGKCRNKTMIDRDRDGYICNPATGEDDLPVGPQVRGNLDKKTREKLIEMQRQVDSDLANPERWRQKLRKATYGDTGDKKLNDMLVNLKKRGFLIEQDGNAAGNPTKIEAPPKFKKIWLMRDALGKTNLEGTPLEKIHIWGAHFRHGRNRPLHGKVAAWLLQNYGYDAVNDVFYDFYDEQPNNYEQLAKEKNDFLDNIVDESTDGSYITDAINANLPFNPSGSETAKARKTRRVDADYRERIDEIMALGKEKYGTLDPERELDIDDEEFFADVTELQRLDLTHREAAIYFNITDDSAKDLYDSLGIPTEQNGVPIASSVLDFYAREIQANRPANVPDWYLMRIGYADLEGVEKKRREQAATRAVDFVGDYDPEVINPIPGINRDRGLAKTVTQAEHNAYRDFMDKNIDNPKAIYEAIVNNPRFGAMLAERDWNFYQRMARTNKDRQAAILLESHDDQVIMTLSGMIINLERNKMPYSAQALGISVEELKRLVSIISKSERHDAMLNALKQAGLLDAWVRGKILGIFPSAPGAARRGIGRRADTISAGAKHLSLSDLDTKARKAPKNRLASTPAKPSERIVGSRRNRSGSARSQTSASKIVIDEATEKALAKKVKDHNERMRKQGRKSWSMTNMGDLKAVYRRGAGAFSVSHRPGMTRNQWAMGRVNAFLRILSSGKPNNSRYVGDNDLLSEGHPWKNRTVRGKSVFDYDDLAYLAPINEEQLFFDPELCETKSYHLTAHYVYIEEINSKGLFQGIATFARGLRSRGREVLRNAPFIRNARDGDGDNVVQEGTVHQRPASPNETSLASLMGRLKEPDGGFTFSMNTMSDVESGWAIARKGQGIKVAVSSVFDTDGQVTAEGIDQLQAFLLYQREAFSEEPTDARRVALGAWHNPAEGMIYFDVTDVHSKDAVSVEQATEEAKRQNQISFVDLDEMVAGAKNNDAKDRQIFYDGGGDGSNLIPMENFQPFLDDIRNQRRKADDDLKIKIPKNARIEIAEDNTAMMIASPVEDLSSKHGIQKDWSKVRALPKQERGRIADFYDQAEDLPADEIQQEAREAYEALVKEVEQQFDMLVKELRVKIEFVDDDPYENYLDMLEDFRQNRRLKILKTSVTGGHPFMTDEQNDKFRAVHDAFGHLATGRGFDRHGEEAAFQAHKSMFSEAAAKAAATELRGQNAFLIERGFFGPQKLVILPDDMRKRLLVLLGYKQDKGFNLGPAQKSSDADNAYTRTRSHHVSCGRAFKS